METRWTDDRIRWIEDNHDQQLSRDKGPDNNNEDEDRAYLDPFVDENPYETFAYESVSVHGYKRDADAVWKSTGVTLWRASEYLCDYLTQRVKQQQQDATPTSTSSSSADDTIQSNKLHILELGAGLGLCGLWMHHLLPTSDVCITDGDTDALKLLRENVKRNQLQSPTPSSTSQIGTVTVRQLLWGRDTTQTFMLQQQQQQPSSSHYNERYDMVLASDIVYAAIIVQPLWETVSLLLKKTKSAVFIMAYAKRDVPVTIQHVLDTAKNNRFTYTLVAEDPKGIWVYEFKWKQEQLE